MKKARFSDHIMPRRIVRQFLWLCAESAVLYVIFKITAVIWRSILMGIPASRWMLFFVMAVLMASFPALWEALRLSRDMTFRADFQNSVSDGSYDAKADRKLIFRSDELWNDTAVVAVVYILLYAYRMFRTWFMNMTNPDLTGAETNAINAYFAVENIVFYLVFVLAYAAAHLLFTLAVHKRWNGERLRSDTPTTERKPYM
ncbi:MAG: hypothetical protein IKV66_07590 [Clostridia bacterium]|nr:hypothetical protein [Clostridia bacterium]